MLTDVRTLTLQRDRLRARASKRFVPRVRTRVAPGTLPKEPLTSMSLPTSAELTATDRGITLHGDLTVDRTYDVVINGLHVWSLQPERDMRRRQGSFVCAWPKALRSHLDGAADIELRDHVTQEVVGSTSARLGDRDDLISVRNKDGRPLVLDKWGRMIVRLDSQGSNRSTS